MKKRVLAIAGFLGSFSLRGFYILGPIVILIASDRLRAAEVVVVELAIAAAIKYGARWIFEKYSEPLDIHHAANGTVIGYKVLEWHSDQSVASPIYPYLWKYGWNKSTRRIGGRPGFYAYRDAEQAINNGQASYWFIATVELAGKIVVCEKGYRAEYARVVGLLTPGYSFRRDVMNYTDLLLVERHANYQ